MVNFKDIKVLILGQDPYHGFGQANGLSFSVNTQTKIPPSLNNVFIELANDLNIHIPGHGNLTSWTQQKVLLLNSSLTVEEGKPNSHKKIGWDKFTDKIINQLSKRGNMIFVLWGKSAQKKSRLIDLSQGVSKIMEVKNYKDYKNNYIEGRKEIFIDQSDIYHSRKLSIPFSGTEMRGSEVIYSENKDLNYCRNSYAFSIQESINRH